MGKNRRETGLSGLGLFAIAVMVALLVWAGWFAFSAWNAMSGVKISLLGRIFMTLGSVVMFLLGAGLMALMFYSSRHGMDK